DLHVVVDAAAAFPIGELGHDLLETWNLRCRWQTAIIGLRHERITATGAGKVRWLFTSGDIARPPAALESSTNWPPRSSVVKIKISKKPMPRPRDSTFSLSLMEETSCSIGLFARIQLRSG